MIRGAWHMAKSHFLYMRQVLWILGVGVAGFCIGGKIGAGSGAILGLVWGASIGYGFGNIFSQKTPTRSVVILWAVTLGLVGPLFGVVIEAVPRPYVSDVQLIVAGAIGALVGVLFGLLVGGLQLNRLRRRSTLP